MKFLAYEGGSDTFGPGSLDAKKAANLDPRMRGLCVNYLSTWYRSGGDMMMWFMAGAGNWDTRYGAWELTTDLTLTDTPKIKCVDSVLASPLPAATGRGQLPCLGFGYQASQLSFAVRTQLFSVVVSNGHHAIISR